VADYGSLGRPGILRLPADGAGVAATTLPPRQPRDGLTPVAVVLAAIGAVLFERRDML
jgi:hypothetical protein